MARMRREKRTVKGSAKPGKDILGVKTVKKEHSDNGKGIRNKALERTNKQGVGSAG
jgi:hypothetical protein